MLGFFLSVFQILSLVAGNPLNSGRYLIDSQPLLFAEDSDSDSQVVNSTLILKKKDNIEGLVYYNNNQKGGHINNHHIDAEGVVWRRPYRPSSEEFSNHKGHMTQKRGTTSSPKPTFVTTPASRLTTNIKSVKNQPYKKVNINNHNPLSPIRSRPHRPMSIVSILDRPTAPPTDIIGDRIKTPDTIKSATIKVLDAPSYLKTTVKQINNSKIIVIKKRLDQVPITWTETTTMTTIAQTEVPDMGNFSVAPVLDVWSNVPIPSAPSWASSSKPVKGGSTRPRPTAAQTVVPNLPFMPFLTSLITPLLNKPLTSSAVNSGMQGIKAMQGFLRNSLMGAMFCFLPSAFIALSLTATQRAQLRKIPEVDDMMIFCKKCLENLKEINKDFANSREFTWLNETS